MSHTVKTDGCWNWIGAKRLGYGVLRINGKPTGAHRLSYIHFKGPIKEGKFICHSCDNRACINPLHLWEGSNQENIKDRDRKKRTARIYGENHWLSKYTNSQIAKMREMNKEGFTDKEIGKAFNAHPNYVRLVIRRIRWPHLP
jgi:hypothetical protein